jgi:ubiquinone/menaquinone biosynthesis C-methylase UbiE
VTGWHDPAVPAQQHALAANELTAWRAGGPHGPFDAFAACASRVVFTRTPMILDLGCGAGIWLELFRERWPTSRYLGVDYSAPMVAFAQAQYASWERTRYVQSDQRSLPFLERGTIDLLFHGCCLIHLPPAEWAGALREAARVVHPHGYLLVSKTPIGFRRAKRVTHAFYGTQIVEWTAKWETFADAYQAAGLEAIWEERWNETPDGALVTTLFRKRP